MFDVSEEAVAVAGLTASTTLDCLAISADFVTSIADDLPNAFLKALNKMKIICEKLHYSKGTYLKSKNRQKGQNCVLPEKS